MTATTQSKSQAGTQGCLYIVATPIGNLKDITLRALEVLKEVNLIACEDTRTSRTLLSHYGIATATTSYHEHNAKDKAGQLIARIEQGASIALISDAGTPLISDPGYKLVHQAKARGLEVIPIPGACAAITGLSAAGLASDHFLFAGFLPSKQEARNKELKRLLGYGVTICCYESPQRLLATLEALCNIDAKAHVTMARELTKKHEEILSDLAETLLALLRQRDSIKGECVLYIQPSVKEQHHSDEIIDAYLALALTPHRTKEAAKKVAELTGMSAQALYQRALELQSDGE